MKKRFTDDQINYVNTINIIDYMEYRGLDLKRSNRRVKVKGWNGLDVTPDGRKWKDFASGRGGYVIQFVSWLNACSWKEAVQELLNFSHHAPPVQLSTPQPEPPPPKPFCLPPKAKSYRNLFAYLIKTRKLDSKVVQYCVDQKLIYQDERCNCVFVGYDDCGEPASAFLRGSNEYAPFKMLVEGSRAEYGFTLPGANSRLFIFESPIDLLSYMTLKNIRNPLYFDNRGDHCLSCNGLKYLPILHYLSIHREIRQIVFGVDNDPVNEYGNRPGQDFIKSATQEIMEAFPDRFTTSKQFIADLPRQKDWNQELVRLRKNQEHKKSNRTRQPCR